MLSYQFQPADAWHAQVGHQQIHLGAVDHLQCFLPGVNDAHAIVLMCVLHCFAQEEGHLGLVIYNQDMLGSHSAFLYSGGAADWRVCPICALDQSST